MLITLREQQGDVTVSFHIFKSRNFKLSVSNPKNKYVAYVSVLSQVSNCQGLGRKNKHEILKNDRMPTFKGWKFLGAQGICRKRFSFMDS